MRITKHEHACLVLEKQGQRLVIDPGNFTTPLIDVTGVVGIVITHEHPDHWTPDQLAHLLDKNPEARILAPESVAHQATEFTIEQTREGDSVDVGVFHLDFYGTTHAVIHSSIPVITNVGVMVDETLFYPGDAFTVPPVPVPVLAAPASAPWLKIGEAMDYVAAVKPARAFGVHEMVLSVVGKNMHFGRLKAVTEENGGVFDTLEPGESIDV